MVRNLRVNTPSALVPIPESSPLLSRTPTSSTPTVNSFAADTPSTQKRPYSFLLGPFLIVLCLLSFILQSEATAFVQTKIHYSKPYLILWCSHAIYILILPMQAAFVCLKDGDLVKYHRLIATKITTIIPESRSFTLDFSIRILLFTIGSAFSSYCWYLAVNYASISIVTSIFNTSSFFALVFSVWLKVDNERFEVRNVSAILISIFGIVIISDPWEFIHLFSGSAFSITSNQYSWIGSTVAITGAMCYGLYQAAYKKYLVCFNRPSVYFANFITGCIGLMTLLVLWIPIVVLHVLDVEPFALPTWNQAFYLFLIAFMGLVFNASFMLLIAFTSPVTAAMSIMMTIPCVSIADLSLGVVSFIPLSTILGSLFICTGFVLMVSSYYASKRVTNRAYDLLPSSESL